MINILISLTILSSIFVIISNKIEISVFSLIFTFALSGILFILFGLPLFGFIYFIVYTAAISILFIFVIMMLDIPLIKEYNNTWSLFLIILFLSAIYFLNFIDIKSLHPYIIYHQEWNFLFFDTIQSFAFVLYSELFSLLFLLSIILFFIMVSIVNFLI